MFDSATRYNSNPSFDLQDLSPGNVDASLVACDLILRECLANDGIGKQFPLSYALKNKALQKRESGGLYLKPEVGPDSYLQWRGRDIEYCLWAQNFIDPGYHLEDSTLSPVAWMRDEREDDFAFVGRITTKKDLAGDFTRAGVGFRHLDIYPAKNPITLLKRV